MPNPFGIELGSTPHAGMADYDVVLKSVPKPHPAFKTYLGKWHPERGLVYILASSDVFEEDSFACSSRSLYDTVKRQLNKVYGQSESLEFMEPNSIYPDDSDFVDSLLREERLHATRWCEETGANLDAGIERIFLSIVGVDYGASKVMLSYSLKGGADIDEHVDDFGAMSL